MIKRRKTRKVTVGGLPMGGDFPVRIQSMCSTRMENISATVKQILKLEKEGCELVRVAIPEMPAAKNIAIVKSKIHIPLIADIHFDYRLAVECIKNGADKIRINPGNIGGEQRVAAILKEAKKYKTAVRLGINSGSLEQKLLSKYGRPTPEALAQSALNWVKIFEKNKFHAFTISVKSSDVYDTVAAYQILADKCDYPLHIGITEAGLPPYGSIKSAIGIGSLLLRGIGDTIRVSISADPIEAVRISKQILKALHLYKAEPEIISCPTCGRTEIDLIKLVKEVEAGLKDVHRPIRVSVMGCAVNGPGEARESDWGICGGRGQGAIFKKGKIIKWVPEKHLVREFIKMIKSDVIASKAKQSSKRKVDCFSPR